MPALVALHVKTWADTYWLVRRPPTFTIRQSQWSQVFKINDGSWFCYVAESKTGRLVGFAHAKTYGSADLPAYKGQLSKIYLLREYQRLGIGKRLICTVAHQFISRQINSMVLFSEVQNPSGYFYEALSAERLTNKQGKFSGAYGWKNLQALATIC
ncbi:GNAT family N-acetyltransferase [Mucilaginibacter corticis]|nr:GNAT family N-acetyltransferase [Mucilaginibacter corticis]